MNAPQYIADYQTKSFDGIYWLKIFYHSCRNGDFFTQNDVYNISTDDKYSILYLLNKNFTIKGKYEFLLEYPETQKFNHWRQTNNPLTDNETYDNGPYKVKGYEKINIQMESNHWGGLARSASVNTLLEGCIGDTDWWYAIGQYNSKLYNGSIAGENSVSEVYLWLGLRKLIICTCYSKIHHVKLSYLCISLFLLK